MPIALEGTMMHVTPSGQVMAEWVNIGEGWSGEWDPDDPEDQNLLRFDLHVRAQGATQDPDEWWEDVDDASYCTRMPADADDDLLHQALAYIAREFEWAYPTHHKRRLEELSWIGPEDFA